MRPRQPGPRSQPPPRSARPGPAGSVRVLFLVLSFLLPLVLVAPMALAAAGPASTMHGPAPEPAPRAVLIILDGPRHDMAHAPDGPLEALYAMEEAAVAINAWTAGRPKTLPGHAALMTGQRDDISNLGFQAPRAPTLFHVLNQTRDWGQAEMVHLYQSRLLWILSPGDQVTKHRVDGDAPSLLLLDALEETLADPGVRFVVATFAEPDRTGHSARWGAHGQGLRTIADGLVPLIEQEVRRGSLVVVTADHGRSCEDPTGHGGLGPWHAADPCDSHIPLLVYGWDVVAGTRALDCITHADVTALIAASLGTTLANATGRVPTELLGDPSPFQSRSCPPRVGGLQLPPAMFALGLTVFSGVAARRRR